MRAVSIALVTAAAAGVRLRERVIAGERARPGVAPPPARAGTPRAAPPPAGELQKPIRQVLPERAAAHRPGPPRRRHRGRVPLRGRRRALREAGSARLRALPGAHALQGHGQVGRRGTSIARWKGWAAAPTPSPPSTTPTSTSSCRAEALETAIQTLADMAVPLHLRPQGGRPRAPGHLRGGQHRDGQSEDRHRPAALRPRLRRQSLRLARRWARARP